MPIAFITKKHWSELDIVNIEKTIASKKHGDSNEYYCEELFDFISSHSDLEISCDNAFVTPISISARLLKLVLTEDELSRIADIKYCDFPVDTYVGKRAAYAVLTGCRMIITKYLHQDSNVNIGWRKTKHGITIATATGYAMISDNARHATLVEEPNWRYVPKGDVITPIGDNTSAWVAWLAVLFMCAYTD